MKQVLNTDGGVMVENIPAPTADEGEVLVEVEYSAISAGTETSAVEGKTDSFLRRSLTDPEKLARGLELLKKKGFWQTKELIDQRRKGSGHPIGYSTAGKIVDIGSGIDDLAVGDWVACAGSGYANHAEVVSVPRNLVTTIPDDVPPAHASSVAIGSIALQSVRRAEPELGETIVVIGLGLIGQLTAQMLQANGCTVIGTDIREERVSIAENLGVDVGIHPDRQDDVESVVRLTDGHGADGAIVTASSPSDEIVSTAFQMCRRKGRVVLVGDVGLDLNREDIYEKELDFLMSTSYGAGRYDDRYEQNGLDYPIGYVRWTEQRNMEAYLNLLAAEEVAVEPLIDEVHSIENAAEAYASFDNGDRRPLLVLLSYDKKFEQERRTLVSSRAHKGQDRKVSVALVGAGSFAKSTHLPNLNELDGARLHAVVSGTGTNAKSTADRHDAAYATTDYKEVLADGEVDAVLIATRHHLHAEQLRAGLEAGKHVFVEKPLALTRNELNDIKSFFEENKDSPILLTGFNRRFSPYARHINEVIADRSNPMVLNYRMNAGHISSDHWIQTEEGGGRNRGEACHIYDLFTYLTGARVAKVSVGAMNPETDYYNRNDNFNTLMTFEDGSTATLTYAAAGSTDHPKERLELYVDGNVFELSEYQELSVTGGIAEGMETRTTRKGHKEELKEFVSAIQEGGEWPIPLWQQIQATEIALNVERGMTRDTGGEP